MLKLLMVANAETHGWTYVSRADSMAHDEGDPPGVKREKVR